ncbi:MAG: hypothetical protein M3526_06765, partial [Actinomycetota bacterium]|nr:hypothetical protein [Actinomycetota bacterium]
SLSVTDIVNDLPTHSEETAPHIVKRDLHTSEGFPSYPSEEDSEETPSPPKLLEKCAHGKGALACIQCSIQNLSDEKAIAL